MQCEDRGAQANEVEEGFPVETRHGKYLIGKGRTRLTDAAR